MSQCFPTAFPIYISIRVLSFSSVFLTHGEFLLRRSPPLRDDQASYLQIRLCLRGAKAGKLLVETNLVSHLSVNQSINIRAQFISRTPG